MQSPICENGCACLEFNVNRLVLLDLKCWRHEMVLGVLKPCLLAKLGTKIFNFLASLCTVENTIKKRYSVI